MAANLARDGYALVPNVFSPGEIGELLKQIPDLGSAAGTRGLLEFAWCRELARDPRIAALVGAALSDRAIAVRAILFDKSPSMNWTLGWHQDTKIALRSKADVPGFGAWSEKEGIVHCLPPVSVLESCLAVRIHLDPCGADNGPLQVLPGTHLAGLQTSPPTLAPVVCMAQPGDVILMRPLLWHSSSKSDRPDHRRVIHIEYSSAKLPNPLEWAFA